MGKRQWTMSSLERHCVDDTEPEETRSPSVPMLLAGSSRRIPSTPVEPGLVTPFWGDVPFSWLDPLPHSQAIEIDGVWASAVSATNLLPYHDRAMALTRASDCVSLERPDSLIRSRLIFDPRADSMCVRASRAAIRWSRPNGTPARHLRIYLISLKAALAGRLPILWHAQKTKKRFGRPLCAARLRRASADDRPTTGLLGLAALGCPRLRFAT
jgi:hypothetical protein